MSASEHDFEPSEATLAGPPLAELLTDDHTLDAGTQPSLAPGPITQLLRDGAKLGELGHYVLLDKLGEGGMGVVFAAYDKTLDRKVAIKLLRAGGSLRGEAQRRLIREAQAMARLSHPNVVQIYEIGELDDDGSTRAAVHVGDGSKPVFIVMEFIDGQTLTAWRKQQARSTTEILAVFDAAGHGLAAAHQKGLIHRDFKPDNVMIRSDGRVVVMDFGLARERSELAQGELAQGKLEPSAAPVPPIAIDEARSLSSSSTSELSVDLTATGAMLGTPAYMSPEQFLGAASDAKTDQFSFCVALWEVLNGSRPFAGKSLGELMFAVTTGQRAAPSPEVPSWLIAALERGLALEPGDRWPSMDALLLALAADPTRRRRWWIAGLSSAALLGALVGGSWLLDAQAETRARQACTREAKAIDSAWNDAVRSQLDARFTQDQTLAESWSHASTWMDTYAREWTSASERDCLATSVEQTRSADDHARFVACLDDGRVAAQALVEVWLSAEDRVVAHAATAAAELPPISWCQSEAWLAQRIPPPDDPDTRERVTALRAELEHIAALGLIGEFEPALERARAALVEAEQLGWAPLIAEALVEVGEAEAELDTLEAARASFERASLVATACAHDVVGLRASILLTSLVGYQLSDHTTGRYWAGLAEALLARMNLAGTVHEAALRSSIGDLQWSAGDYSAALASYEAALALYRDALGPNHPQVARQYGNVGYIHMEQGRYEQAIELYHESIRISEATLGPAHPNVGAALSFMGQALSLSGKYEQAAEVGERVLSLYERAYGRDHTNIADVLNNLGIAYSHLDRKDEALAAYQRALHLIETTLGPDHPSNGTALNNIAMIHTDRGEYEQAMANYQRALELELEHRGPTHPHVAIELSNIGQLLRLQGQHEQSLAQYQRALELFENALGPDHPHVAFTRLKVADQHLLLGHDGLARPLYEQVLAQVGDAHEPEFEAARFHLAKLCEQAGELERAVALATAARAGLEQLGRADDKLGAQIDAWLSDHPAP